MPNFFKENDTKTALEAQYAAQKIAFAPIIFQVARSMRELGILEALYTHDKHGLSIEEISQIINTNGSTNKAGIYLTEGLEATPKSMWSNGYGIT